MKDSCAALLRVELVRLMLDVQHMQMGCGERDVWTVTNHFPRCRRELASYHDHEAAGVQSEQVIQL